MHRCRPRLAAGTDGIGRVVLEAAFRRLLAHWHPVLRRAGGADRSGCHLLPIAVPEHGGQRQQPHGDHGRPDDARTRRHQPTDGPEGIRKNLELIRTIREAVGPDVEIMFDAWSSWDVPYTKRMAELAAEYRPWWFEEPVMADMIHQYAELRRSVSTVAIAGGEHEYTRWGIKDLLEAGAVDILQPDPTWAGGLTEMTRICALASAYGIPLIAHCGFRAASHLIAAQTLTTCPLQEWLIQSAATGEYFLKHRYWPEDGYLDLPPGPGLAMELDESRIESRELLDLS